MAKLKKPSADAPQTKFALQCDAYLRSSKQQQTLAREMIQRVREMCERAAQMRKERLHFHLP